MAKSLDEYFILDASLQQHPGIYNLLEQIHLSYTLRTGDPQFSDSKIPQESQKIAVAPINSVWLGFWPTQGPVQEVHFYPTLPSILQKGLLQVDGVLYDNDCAGNPRLNFRLTDDKKMLNRLGLASFCPGHALSFYLHPRSKAKE